MSSRPELKIDWATYEAAKYACLHWHYSKTIPTGKNNYLGAWEGGRFIGVVIFGLGATGTMGKPYGLNTFQIAELVRVALDSHISPVTKIVAIAIKMIMKKNPGLRMLISFADPFHGHNGAIYQAGNWTFTGQCGIGEMYLLRDGSMAHPRRFTGRGWNKKKPIPADAVKIKTPGKYRYLMPLDDEMRKRIEPLRKPYPKRDKQAIGNDQLHSGGAAPTVTLQNNNEVPNAENP
jgi:hypothetical protein